MDLVHLNEDDLKGLGEGAPHTSTDGLYVHQSVLDLYGEMVKNRRHFHANPGERKRGCFGQASSGTGPHWGENLEATFRESIDLICLCWNGTIMSVLIRAFLSRA
jgi:hypothetical protein